VLRFTPPGEDGLDNPRAAGKGLYEEAEDMLVDGASREPDRDSDDEFNEKPSDDDFLRMVTESEAQAALYQSQVNRRSWSRVYRAFHQEHFVGSKYTTSDYKNRSKLFIPKTRSAIKKDMAAVAASLFGSVNAINTAPGDEGDPGQRASADLMGALVNYRTSRSSGKAALPWFHVAMGARQTSMLTGICLSKQYWKLELKRKGTEKFKDDPDDEFEDEKERDVWEPEIDRPDVILFAPENFTIDPAADWTNPAQDAAYIHVKYPMRIDEIRRKQKDPRNPWKALSITDLKAVAANSRADMEAIRRAREQGLDRYDETQTGKTFDVIWVYESFIRTAGEDWTFLSVGGKHLLTDPRPTSEVYPEQYGERPLVLGYGAFEAFRIFPMSPAESWQMLQQQANDLQNLTLDAVKQSVMPVAKVVRGRQVDLEALKKRGQGTAIMVNHHEDVMWDRPPDIGAAVENIKREIDIDFDDIAGQQNYGTVEQSNSLGKTLGGLKLAAGAANAVQEFDIRIWIETYTEKVLAQIVRLEQFYESDQIILGICGNKAKLLQKHGVSEITDELLENEVSISVSIGLGSGDPAQRLAKLQNAVSIVTPILQASKDFQSGKREINPEAFIEEVFGAVGYRDGGARFFRDGAGPQDNPMVPLEQEKLKSEAELNRARAKNAVLTGISAAAKVGVGLKQAEDNAVNRLFDDHYDHVEQVGRANAQGHQHGMALHAAKQAAKGLNPDGTPMAPPGEGGAPGAPAAAGAELIQGATNAGAGNDGLSAQEVGGHGVPASDAGQQQIADAASAQKNLDDALKKPKKRTVTIAKRGPDGRASEFHIQDH
jgi:hypothetical protein